MFLAGAFNQEVTYWAQTAIDSLGTRTFDTPEVVKARWEDRNDLVITLDGEQVPSKSVIYTKETFVLGGYLALGDYSTTVDPTTLDNAFLIKSFQTFYGINGKFAYNEAVL